MSRTPQEILSWIKNEGIQVIDLKFIDMPGIWQHLTLHHSQIDESSFTEGVAFDGSSIRGWKAINESDMAMVPDPNTAWIDPFMSEPTLSMICSIQEPRTGEPYDRCPRVIAQKALDYLNASGLGDTAFFGPEAEFFVFEDVRFEQTENTAFYQVDTKEGRWNSGAYEEGGNLAYKPGYKQGYFPVSPTDSLQDLRTEMLLTMEKCGVEIEKHHHEVATAGQCEIGVGFNSLVQKADEVLNLKYVVQNVAHSYGKTATERLF